MIDNTLYAKAEMDYRAEKIKRGITGRRHDRHRKALARRQRWQTETQN